MPHPDVLRDFECRVRDAIAHANDLRERDHGPTVGSVRESILAKLIDDVLPPAMKTFKGFLIDSHGGRSNEVDIVVYNQVVTPKIAIGSFINDVPVESCLYAIEVKSKLNAKEVKDCIRKGKSVKKLKPMTYDELVCVDGVTWRPISKRSITRTVVFAWDSDLKVGNEVERFQKYSNEEGEEPNVDLIVVPGKSYHFFDHTDRKWCDLNKDSEIEALIAFLVGLCNTAYEAQNSPPRVKFGNYILG